MQLNSILFKNVFIAHGEAGWFFGGKSCDWFVDSDGKKPKDVFGCLAYDKNTKNSYIYNIDVKKEKMKISPRNLS